MLKMEIRKKEPCRLLIEFDSDTEGFFQLGLITGLFSQFKIGLRSIALNGVNATPMLQSKAVVRAEVVNEDSKKTALEFEVEWLERKNKALRGALRSAMDAKVNCGHPHCYGEPSTKTCTPGQQPGVAPGEHQWVVRLDGFNGIKSVNDAREPGTFVVRGVPPQ